MSEVTHVYGLASPHAAGALVQMGVPLVPMPRPFVCPHCGRFAERYDGQDVCPACVESSFAEHG